MIDKIKDNINSEKIIFYLQVSEKNHNSFYLQYRDNFFDFDSLGILFDKAHILTNKVDTGVNYYLFKTPIQYDTCNCFYFMTAFAEGFIDRLKKLKKELKDDQNNESLINNFMNYLKGYYCEFKVEFGMLAFNELKGLYKAKQCAEEESIEFLAIELGMFQQKSRVFCKLIDNYKDNQLIGDNEYKDLKELEIQKSYFSKKVDELIKCIQDIKQDNSSKINAIKENFRQFKYQNKQISIYKRKIYEILQKNLFDPKKEDGIIITK